MADITNQKQGSGVTSGGLSNVRTIEGVIDVTKAVADGFVTGDNIELMDFNAGDILLAVDARIIEALVISGSPTTDIGTTVGDPDEYVDAQTNTAVGAYTSYVAASIATARIATDLTLYCELNGTLVTSGKIAWKVALIPSADDNVEQSDHRTYTN